MKTTIIENQPAPGTTLYIHSIIGWGWENEHCFRFNMENGIITHSFNSRFENWIGKTSEELQKYIKSCEEAEEIYKRKMEKSFNKRADPVWRAEHWVETEGGDGYYS